MTTQADRDRLGVWSVLLDEDLNIDRRQCTRTVPMQVLNVSFPRTGTASMQEALAILGYPSYHFASIFENCHDADMWIPALHAKLGDGGNKFGKREFDQLLGHVGATCDTPACLFWADLLEAYPDAKVVLVDRDLDEWQKSFDGLLDGILNPVACYVLAYLDPFFFGRINRCAKLWIRAMTGSSDITVAKRNAKDAYRRHYEQVRRSVPKDRLLEYRLGSGWGPLCEFLGKPIPKSEFPHRNEAQCLDEGFKVFAGKALKRIALNTAVVVGVGAVVVQVALVYLA